MNCSATPPPVINIVFVIDSINKSAIITYLDIFQPPDYYFLFLLISRSSVDDGIGICTNLWVFLWSNVIVEMVNVSSKAVMNYLDWNPKLHCHVSENG